MQPIAKQANRQYTVAHMCLTRFPKIILEDFNDEYCSLKPELLGVISHELRTPLSGILGMVYQLHRINALTPEQQECINDIKIAGNRLLSIVDDLLGINKNEQQTAEVTMPLIKQKRILLVEDDRLVQKIHTGMLQEMGFKVDLAETGQDALIASEKDYPLILMDIGLPDISGIEVITEIRRREGHLRKTPIIALTAYVQAEMKTACINAGANMVINKPVQAEELIKIIMPFVGQNEKQKH